MKSGKTTEKSHIGIIPQLAKKIGERSVNQTCMWWSHQPKVPASMKKDSEK